MRKNHGGRIRALGRAIAAAMIVSASGCGADPEPSARATARPELSASKLLADLGDPVAVLIVTGQQEGHFEPCGCSRGQAGGLLRRSNLVERLRAAGRPTVLIDLGGLADDPASARGGPEHAAIRFRFAAEALAILRYDAIAIAPDDLKLGAGRALEIFRDRLGPETKLVAANVQPAETHRSIVRPSRIVQAGPIRLGLTAVVDPAAMAAVSPDVRPHLPTIQSPDDSLPAVLADLESRSDFQVLMVQGPPDLAARLASAFPGFEIVVATSEGETPRTRRPEFLNDGRTTLVSVGRKGMYVGAFAFGDAPEHRPRYRLLTLDDRYDGPGSIKERIPDAYRAALRSARLVEEAPQHPAPGGANYVGALTCRSCHPKTYERWAATPHARAFESILRDPRPDVVFDPDCVACHTTGFGVSSGWRSREATPQLAGNQCENCHGPGSRHVEKPDDRPLQKVMAIGDDRARGRLCARCHDHDNAPGFDPAQRWSQIVHDRLDPHPTVASP